MAEGGGRRPDRAGPGGRCDRLGCTALLPDGRAVALIRDRRAFPEDCARAAVVITRLSAPSTCTGPLVIDRRDLAAHGAVALRADGGGFTMRAARGDGRSLPWRPRTAAPAGSDAGADPPAEGTGGMASSEAPQAPADAPAEPLQ